MRKNTLNKLKIKKKIRWRLKFENCEKNIPNFFSNVLYAKNIKFIKKRLFYYSYFLKLFVTKIKFFYRYFR